MDTISVVIPLYNKAPYIGRTIDSVLAQERLPEEIIVIDDGSTDGGGDIVKQFKDPSIRLVRQENQGLSAARNRGISLAKGELIAFLDADDVWKPGFLKVISEMRELYPQAGIYATAYDVINPEGKRTTLKFSFSTSQSEQGLIDNFFHAWGPQPLPSAMAVPKEVLDKIGGFPEGEAWAEDVDMLIKIGICYPIAWNSKILATYCQDATNRVYGVKKFYHEPTFLSTLNEAIKSGTVPTEKIQDLREYAAHWQYCAARQLILNGEKELALKIIGQTRGTRMFRHQGWILALCSYFPLLLKLLMQIYKSYLNVKNLFVMAR